MILMGHCITGTSCQTVVPTMVSSGLLGKKIIDVSCGSHHSIALTSEGEVTKLEQGFSWRRCRLEEPCKMAVLLGTRMGTK